MYTICIEKGNMQKFVGCFSTRKEAEILLPKYKRTCMACCYVIAIPT